MITWITALCKFNEAISHAVQDHPRWTGHSGEFWQNMAHWRRKCKPLQYFCLENPMNSVKRQKDGRWAPRSEGVQYATGGEQRNTSRKNEEAEPKQKEHTLVNVSGGESKVWCYKEQYCIGNWNVRSMNQGELEVVNGKSEHWHFRNQWTNQRNINNLR